MATFAAASIVDALLRCRRGTGEEGDVATAAAVARRCPWPWHRRARREGQRRVLPTSQRDPALPRGRKRRRGGRRQDRRRLATGRDRHRRRPAQGRQPVAAGVPQEGLMLAFRWKT